MSDGAREVFELPPGHSSERVLDIAALRDLALRDVTTLEMVAPLVRLDSESYVRIVLHRDEVLEAALLCFSAGQTSTIHDHQGSGCVIRMLEGAVLETLFEDSGSLYAPLTSRILRSGSISGVTGWEVHQISNVAHGPSVLLNYYSPPFGAMPGIEAPVLRAPR